MNIRLQIKSQYSSYSPKEKLIADYILQCPSDFVYKSISELAQTLNVADSTIFQFTKKLGFSGFKEFKMEIAIQENDLATTSIHENIEKNDSLLSMAHKVFDSNIATLTDTKKLLNETDLQNAVNYIKEANHLYFFGVGGSDIVATDAYHKFLRSSIPAFHSTDYHIQLIEAALLTEKDCIICISHSGESKETIKIAQTAKETGAKIIILTSHPNSTLALLGDIVFTSMSEEIDFRSEALSSRLGQLSILDSIYVMVMFTNYEKSLNTIKKVRTIISDIKS
ncbi:transcriptional regulator, RpiR family [Granulicatella balaenopterae]|uniref:Transcriptional regulator, RpiR family n=1 Tax=Granulicatella balaenopterae TaxID=137733 RepID=A0A1H9P4S7_9LACT|nr:MurR/RpiR family transcriptional regulator [Granulicatella balaenopterae]SER42829.1 transcriptional regulator, RpiR family [Granulicatella balaenopterae]